MEQLLPQYCAEICGKFSFVHLRAARDGFADGDLAAHWSSPLTETPFAKLMKPAEGGWSSVAQSHTERFSSRLGDACMAIEVQICTRGVA